MLSLNETKKKKAGSSQNSFEPRCAVFEGVKLCFEGSFARLTFFLYVVVHFLILIQHLVSWSLVS